MRDLEANKEYVLCAAIWLNDGKKRVHLPKNIETGIVVCGRRHHNAFRVLQEIIPKPANAIQGFMTSHDRFVTRAEAAHIALNAGQIDRPTSSLHSEDLY